MEDAIIRELRRIRDEYAERFNYDIEAMIRDVMERQARSERKIVARSPKRVPVTQNSNANNEKVTAGR